MYQRVTSLPDASVDGLAYVIESDAAIWLGSCDLLYRPPELWWPGA